MKMFIKILTSFLLLVSCALADTNSTSHKAEKKSPTPWVVDGHVLPPEPDPVVNNATLLGVDVNHNGVRDDVERWIYETYNEYVPCHQELDYNDVEVIDGEVVPNAIEVCEENPIPYHPIVRAVAMQGARAAQIIIQEPERAKEIMKYYDNAHFCAMYISLEKKQQYRQDVIPVIKKDIFKEEEGFISKLFNTTKRARAYAKYNYYLSGGVYRIPTESETINGCDVKVKQLLKELK